MKNATDTQHHAADPLQQLFDDYQPAMPHGDQFMAHLEASLRVADIVRQLQQSQQRSQWRILLLTFVTGLATGLVAAQLVVPEASWSHQLTFRLMGTLVHLSVAVLPSLAQAAVSLLCALIAMAVGLAALRRSHSRLMRRTLSMALG